MSRKIKKIKKKQTKGTEPKPRFGASGPSNKGLCEWTITNVHQILTIMFKDFFKNVLNRIFEVENKEVPV